MGLVPFAPHTVAIGLADRFPPAAVVTAASEGSQVRRLTAAGNVVVSQGVLLVASLVSCIAHHRGIPHETGSHTRQKHCNFMEGLWRLHVRLIYK